MRPFSRISVGRGAEVAAQRQMVDIVEVYIVDLTHCCLSVARHSQVDEEEGARWSDFHHGGDCGIGQDRVCRGRTADYDIELRQGVVDIAEAECLKRRELRERRQLSAGAAVARQVERDENGSLTID